MRPGSFEEVGERRGGLAEAHVVGEAPAEAELGEELHPRQAAALIVTEFAGEVRRLVRLLEHLVGEPVEQGADPVEVERLGFVALGGVGERDQRVLVVAVVGVGELEEFERVDAAVVLAQRR